MSLVNLKAASRSKAFAYVRLAVGGIFAGAFGSMVYSSDNNANKVLAGILFVPFFFVFIGGLKAVVRLRRLYRIDSVLSSTQNHSIELSALAEVTGIKEKRLRKNLKRFIKKKFFQNCVLGDSELIIQGENNEEEITLICPQCQKSFTAKNGAVARCPECASIINIK